MTLSEEQILSLAPDESSRKSGKELSNPSKWVSKGASDQALWGECQGSGSKPYQAQIDLVDIAFKCSCPSRKFPCKHGLGLLLLFARDKKSFSSTEAPAWVTDWLNKRTEKLDKQSEKKEKPVDEAAQTKRQQARQSKVIDGIDELITWMKDIIRNGILTIPEKGNSFFENMSRRLIDAQAPGLAGMVRNLGETGFYAEGWHSRFMDQLLRIYMVAEGFRNSSFVHESLQQDLKTWIGFTQNHEELKEQNGVLDTWLVLGKQISEVDSVITEKFWLYGTETQSYAMFLQFIVRGQGSQINLTPGMFLKAELIFFASTLPQRALIKKQILTEPVHDFNAFENWSAVAEKETDMNSKLPFRSEMPFIISKLKPVHYNQQWWLQDSDNQIMPLKPEFRNIWKLLSLSGGQPLDMAVVGREDQFEPLGLWQGRNYKII